MNKKSKILIAAVIFLLSSVNEANAGGLPPTNVTCSISSDGAFFSAGLTFSGSSSYDVSSLTYDWYFGLLKADALDPTLISNYSTGKFILNSQGNGVDFTYAQLLQNASNDPNQSILVWALARTSSLIGGNSGACYVSLAAVLSALSAPAPSPTPTVVITPTPSPTPLQTRASRNALDFWNARATSEIARNMAQVQQLSSVANVLYPGHASEIKSVISQFPSSPVFNSSDVQDQQIFSDYQKAVSNWNFVIWNTEILHLKQLSKQKSTITCIKGKLSKKITAVNAKCPTGFKKA